ncbi:hypothetical protein ACFVUS_00755 [Nocardia sp. NPDC058058]
MIAELETTFGIYITPDEIPQARTLREVWVAMERKFQHANLTRLYD